jgi:excisionase family DNA binding protein
MNNLTHPGSTTTLKDHISTLEVAKLLGMAVRSVQLMVDRGDLEAWKTPGGHRRITRQSVERWRGGERQAPIAPSTFIPTPTPDVTPREKNTDTARILLIEDSMHFQNLMKLLLSQQFPGIRLDVASDGISGLALAGQFQPDILIVDILLPGIDGATLITGLRAHPQFHAMQLIVCTSLGVDQLAPYAFALDGIPVIHKPRMVADLPPLLTQILKKIPLKPQA